MNLADGNQLVLLSLKLDMLLSQHVICIEVKIIRYDFHFFNKWINFSFMYNNTFNNTKYSLPSNTNNNASPALYLCPLSFTAYPIIYQFCIMKANTISNNCLRRTLKKLCWNLLTSKVVWFSCDLTNYPEHYEETSWIGVF